MLFFRMFRKVDPNCVYCKYGTRISEREVVCLKRGVVPVEHHCRAFRYDPLKRVPPRPAVLRTGGLSEADFSLGDAMPGQESLFAGLDKSETMENREIETNAKTGDTSGTGESTAVESMPEPDSVSEPDSGQEAVNPEEPEIGVTASDGGREQDCTADSPADSPSDNAVLHSEKEESGKKKTVKVKVWPVRGWKKP